MNKEFEIVFPINDTNFPICARELQEKVGDYLCYNGRRITTVLTKRSNTFSDIIDIIKKGSICCVEVKGEGGDSAKWGNLVLECISNKKKNRPGWMYNLLYTDRLYYIFGKRGGGVDRIFNISFPKLKKKFINDYRYRFQEVIQHKNIQENDTYLHPVSINTIYNDIGFEYYNNNLNRQIYIPRIPDKSERLGNNLTCAHFS